MRIEGTFYPVSVRVEYILIIWRGVFPYMDFKLEIYWRFSTQFKGQNFLNATPVSNSHKISFISICEIASSAYLWYAA